MGSVPVIALSGRINAGKSTIARALSDQLEWPLASFGDYVRSEAERLGRSQDRENLQELGSELIHRLGWEAFCRETLGASGLSASSRPCVVEGIRHIDALETLRKIFHPTPVHLVHIDLPPPERTRRFAAVGVDEGVGDQWEDHSTESDVARALPAEASLRIESEQAPERPVAKIVAWLSELDP
jgi:hypothetical protein